MVNLAKFLPLEWIRYNIFSLSGLGLIQYYPIRKIVEYLWSRVKSDVVHISGQTIFLDSKDSLFLSLRTSYDDFETNIISKEINEGDCVIDMGANIGYYTLFLAKAVGEKGTVISIEPDPQNFAILKKNVEVNGYKNVKLIQKAISDKEGTITLYLSELSNALHRIHESEFCSQKISVECSTIDNILKELNVQKKITFIKMDIEGSEIKAINGMKETLSLNDELKILVEFAPISLVESGFTPKLLLQKFKENNFEIKVMDDKNGLKNVNDKELLEKYTPEKKNFVNLLCSKN